ncbi:MAG: glycosyltransferase [Myxococcota bacterium]
MHGLFSVAVTSAMWALRARGVPYVVRPCGMLDPWSLGERRTVKALYYRGVERANLRRAGAIQVSTAHEEDAVRRLELGVRVARLPQGVGKDAVTPGPSPWPRPYVLFLGRVARKKGLTLLVEAMRPLDIDLVIVGPDELGHGAELDALGHARMHRLGAERDLARKAAWFAHAAAFALPSSDENFGIAVVEAAQRGAPLVVSDQVGLAPEVLADGAGRVVAQEVPALREALVDVLRRGRPAFELGARRFAARFDWPPLAARLEALYRETLALR